MVSKDEIRSVREVYEAWNRGDLDSLLAHTAPDFEFRTARRFPDGVEVTLEYAQLFTIRKGLISATVGYASWEGALEAVGLSR